MPNLPPTERSGAKIWFFAICLYKGPRQRLGSFFWQKSSVFLVRTEVNP